MALGQYAALGGHVLILEDGLEILMAESARLSGRDACSQGRQKDPEEDHGDTPKGEVCHRVCVIGLGTHWKGRMARYRFGGEASRSRIGNIQPGRDSST
jgi:hypothetical protein